MDKVLNYSYDKYNYDYYKAKLHKITILESSIAVILKIMVMITEISLISLLVPFIQVIFIPRLAR